MWTVKSWPLILLSNSHPCLQKSNNEGIVALKSRTVESIIILWLRWPYLYFLLDTNKPRVRFRRIKTSKKPILQVTDWWQWMKISTRDIGFRWSSKRNRIEKQKFGINLATMGASSPLLYICIKNYHINKILKQYFKK